MKISNLTVPVTQLFSTLTFSQYYNTDGSCKDKMLRQWIFVVYTKPYLPLLKLTLLRVSNIDFDSESSQSLKESVYLWSKNLLLPFNDDSKKQFEMNYLSTTIPDLLQYSLDVNINRIQVSAVSLAS